ncbi:MAG: 30S ribosomal protein S17 [Candidatus Marinimicrobia bacterium]|nr:30S ribosomal protein S17 [Candidatus Neomarinimicrobiota bacterium]MDP6936306.1 30S ribosomal protein S17 [Candidatus Neomarinimicrobiota bacterium]
MAKDNRKQLTGRVLESKMDKTAVVQIDTRGPHPIYKKYVTQSKKYYVHDPENLCNTGDVVSIMECRPKSKLKRWRLNKVEESAVEI